jgi:hypothetical protein
MDKGVVGNSAASMALAVSPVNKKYSWLDG